MMAIGYVKIPVDVVLGDPLWQIKVTSVLEKIDTECGAEEERVLTWRTASFHRSVTSSIPGLLTSLTLELGPLNLAPDVPVTYPLLPQ